jgi:hypothetical protein
MRQQYQGRWYDPDTVLDAVSTHIGVPLEDGKYSRESNTKQVFRQCFASIGQKKGLDPLRFDKAHEEMLNTGSLPEYVLEYYVTKIETTPA